MATNDRRKIIAATSAISASVIISYVAYKKIQEKRAKERKDNLITLLKDSALGVNVREYEILAKKVQYPKIKFKDENGNTPFLYACRYGHAHLVDYILSNLTTLNYASTVLEKNDEGCNAMHLCTHKGYIDTLKLLFQLEPEYIETLIKGKTYEAKWTPLHIAASKGHLDCAQLILSLGVKSVINEKDSKGCTALLMASCNGYSDIVELLLNHDADPSIPVIDGRTPLHYAAHNNNPEIVKLILDARQKPAAELWDDDPIFMLNKSKCSALHESTIMGDLESTKLLVEAGSDINITSRDGSTPLTSAIMRGHVDIIKYLLEQPNIDILTPTMFGFTPLISAASKAQNDIVELLLRDKDLVQNILYRDNDGSTALHHACQSIINNPIDTIKILLDKAKKVGLEEYVDCVDFSGSTPLLSSCWHDSEYLPAIVETLLNYGADPRKENKYGWCCLHVLSQQSSARSKEIYNKIKEHIMKTDPQFFDTFSTTVKDTPVEYYQHPLMRKHLQIPLKERINVLDGDVSTRGISKKIKKAMEDKNLKIAVLLGDDYNESSNLPSLSDLESLAYDTENYINNAKKFNEIVKEKYYPIYKRELEKTDVHKFISFLNEKDLLKYLFTQNIDMMEFQTDIPKEKIITSYGSFYYPKKCTSCDNVLTEEEEESYYWNKINDNLLPECPKCNNLLQPDIKFSPENIEENFLNYCEADKLDVDLLIIIGLKNETYPFDQLISNVPINCARLLINRHNIDEFISYFGDDEIQPNSSDSTTAESYFGKSEKEIKKIVELGGNYRDVVMIGDINKNIDILLNQIQA
jgi:ankyrin repeat protein/NAD-dependent SIR2 family protein deacetylase